MCWSVKAVDGRQDNCADQGSGRVCAFGALCGSTAAVLSLRCGLMGDAARYRCGPCHTWEGRVPIEVSKGIANLQMGAQGGRAKHPGLDRHRIAQTTGATLHFSFGSMRCVVQFGQGRRPRQGVGLRCAKDRQSSKCGQCTAKNSSSQSIYSNQMGLMHLILPRCRSPREAGIPDLCRPFANLGKRFANSDASVPRSIYGKSK